MVDNAAYLTYSCLCNQMDEDMTRRLALELSDLLQNIDPVKPQVREIYVGVVKASKSPQLKSNTCEKYESAADFVDSLLESTSELLTHDITHEKDFKVKDQIEMLRVELRSLRYYLEQEKSIDLLAGAEAIAVEAGSVIYQLFEGVLNPGMAKESSLALSKLLDMFKLGKVLLRKIYVNVEREQILNFPKTDKLGAVHLLLQNLKDLLTDGIGSITLLKDQIQIIQRDLEFLVSVLVRIVQQHHEHEKLDLWGKITPLVYTIEYVIDLVVVEDGSVLRHMLWLSDVIEEIKNIKTEISEIPIPEDNVHGSLGYNLKKISRVRAFSQPTLPRIDGEMVGFRDQEAKVVQLLVCGSEKHLEIASVVGMPGLGKTFLVQQVYNNPIIKDHFYVRAWCCVSPVYDKRELLINILSQVKMSTEAISEKTDEELAGELHRSLLGEKYLIVLDDMWDIEAWNQLQRSFPKDSMGSRIIFTSLFSGLALESKPNGKIHRLRQLDEIESWKLLEKKVFQSRACPVELSEVGWQIARSCYGLRLAVVVVAGLLARTPQEQEPWGEVAEDLSSYLINNDPQGQCMNILDLSYKSLPDNLKTCFLYFGAFLVDKEILVARLIWLWIAEGFIQKNNCNLEYIAESYLMDLIDRNLIIPSKGRSKGGIKACLVHDLVREFCVKKAKGKNFLKLIEGCADLHKSSTSSRSLVPYSRSTSYQQRRLSVHYRRDKKFWSKSSGPCVRSLLFFAPGRIQWQRDEVPSICQGFKLLKILNLMCINLGRTFPEGIVSLALLRYLAICGNFSSLPPSITNLRMLENFLVRAAHSISLPYGILNMTKLRHLHINSSMSLVQLSSDDPSQLDSLQTLSTPFLSHADGKKIMRRFPNLKKLSYGFQESLHSSKKCNQLPKLDFLTELESLKIHYRGQMRHPCEISFPSNIKKLTVSGFLLPWERISIIGELHCLQVLKLLSQAFKGEEWNMRVGEFQKLKYLKLSCLNITRWIASFDCFPRLEQLILDRCFELEEIPSCLGDIPTLTTIQVNRCDDSLVRSIEQIREAQREVGNELEIEIKRGND